MNLKRSGRTFSIIAGWTWKKIVLFMINLRVFLGWSYHRWLTDPVMPVVIFANRDSAEVRDWPSYFR